MAFPTRFPLSIEVLEDRTNPSGNVTVWVGGGVLNLIGDDVNNAVIIEKTGNQSVAVRPLDSDTLINGQVAGAFFGDIRNGYGIKMGGGNDTLQIVGVRPNKVFSIDMGSGNDTLQLDGVKTVRDAFISLGDGDDATILNRSNFARNSYFEAGAGANSINWFRTDFNSGAQVTGFQTSTSTQPVPLVVSPPVPPVSTAPTVTLATTGSNPTAAATIPITATFDQIVGGFIESDLGITNGTVSNFTSADARTYTFDVTPTADGAITISVPADSANAADGTGNTEATPFTVRSIRTTDGMTTTAPSATDSNFVPQSSGISTWDIQTGSGTAATASSTAELFYTGWLTDGTVFDSSLTTGSPASFGLTNTIQGFQLGVAGMQPGGIRRILIPSALGYGSTATGSIPANSDLIFEVKLVSVS